VGAARVVIAAPSARRRRRRRAVDLHAADAACAAGAVSLAGDCQRLASCLPTNGSLLGTRPMSLMRSETLVAVTFVLIRV
jgi:hypothetical protein